MQRFLNWGTKHWLHMPQSYPVPSSVYLPPPEHTFLEYVSFSVFQVDVFTEDFSPIFFWHSLPPTPVQPCAQTIVVPNTSLSLRFYKPHTNHEIPCYVITLISTSSVLGPNIFLGILFSVTSKAILSPQFKLPHSGPMQTSDTNCLVLQHFENETGEQRFNWIIAKLE
jgi:hypothetical protein